VPLGPSEFAIEAVFETSNISFVTANEAEIAKGVFKIYDRRRSDMKAVTLQTRPVGQNSVILSIQGTYGKTGFLQDLLRLFSFQELYAQLSNGGTWRVPWTTWAILGGILLFIVICIILCCVLSPCHRKHPNDPRNGASGAYAYAQQPSQYYPPMHGGGGGGDHWYPPQQQQQQQQQGPQQGQQQGPPPQKRTESSRYDEDSHDDRRDDKNNA